jgi:lipoyl(octanoyl) transferase
MVRVDIDLMEYRAALELQRSLVETKLSAGGSDVVLFLQHPPTVTLGSRGEASDLLMSRSALAELGVAVHASDRGGQATFHGPGQLVVYPIIDLRARGLSARAYVHALEETVVRTLGAFGIKGFRRKHKPGVWTTEQDKIASIGVRIRRGITYHGYSLNVALRQDPCEYIVCCGMPEAKIVSIDDLLPRPVAFQAVREASYRVFAEVFGVVLEPHSVGTFTASVRNELRSL